MWLRDLIFCRKRAFDQASDGIDSSYMDVLEYSFEESVDAVEKKNMANLRRKGKEVIELVNLCRTCVTD